MNEDINKHVREFDSLNNRKVPLDIITKFYLGAVFNVGIEFLNNDYKYSKEEIIKYLSLLIPKDL